MGKQVKLPIDNIVGTQGKMPDATHFAQLHPANNLGLLKTT